VRTIKALGKYFAKSMKYVGDMLLLTRDLKGPKATKPAAIAQDKKNWSIVFKWERETTDYITQKMHWQATSRLLTPLCGASVARPCKPRSSWPMNMLQRVPENH